MLTVLAVFVVLGFIAYAMIRRGRSRLARLVLRTVAFLWAPMLPPGGPPRQPRERPREKVGSGRR